MQKVLITGIAGFLGFSYAKKLSETGLYKIYGIDNLNEFGDYSLKINRLNNLGFKNKEYSKDKEYKSEGTFNDITFQKIDITDFQKINTLIKNNNFDYIIHFASQAGVKYSFENPQLYIDSNAMANRILYHPANLIMYHIERRSSFLSLFIWKERNRIFISFP